MYGPSDMYGDMTLEDVEEFEGLEAEDERQEIDPLGHFERDQFHPLDEHEEWTPDDWPPELDEHWIGISEEDFIPELREELDG